MADHPDNRRALDPGDVSSDERTRNQQRQLALARLSCAAVASGLYDRNEFPEAGPDE